jgi:hypothetical protein
MVFLPCIGGVDAKGRSALHRPSAAHLQASSSEPTYFLLSALQVSVLGSLPDDSLISTVLLEATREVT